MGQYVDGYLIPIKKKNVKSYKKMATLGRNIWMKHGAISYYECEASHLDSQWGIPFSKVYKLKSDETLIFAFITYKSKSHRDRVNKNVHADPKMSDTHYEMPFDMKRFSTGEFKVLVRSQ